MEQDKRNLVQKESQGSQRRTGGATVARLTPDQKVVRSNRARFNTKLILRFFFGSLLFVLSCIEVLISILYIFKLFA
jgi:hypothetical protein